MHKAFMDKVEKRMVHIIENEGYGDGVNFSYVSVSFFFFFNFYGWVFHIPFLCALHNSLSLKGMHDGNISIQSKNSVLVAQILHLFFHLLFFFILMINDHTAITQFIKNVSSSQKKDSVHKFKNSRRANSRCDKNSIASKTSKFTVTMNLSNRAFP